MQYFDELLDGLTPAQCAATGAAVTAGAFGLYQAHVHSDSIKRAFFSTLRHAPGTAQIYAREAEKARSMIRAEMQESTFRGDGVPEPEEIPKVAMTHEAVLAAAKALADAEAHKCRSGKVSGVVYGGEEAHTRLQSEIYSIYALSNGLHPDIFPSVRKMEAEVVRMTISMLQGNRECVGTMTSGGSESILLACKAYRDQGISRGIKHPEIVLPRSAHPAFEKAAAYFNIKLRKAPTDAKTFAVDVAAAERLITPSTVALVGSAPNYPHGIIDDIPALAAIAKKHNIGMHTDACLGGYFLAWARQFCDDITPFDFSVDGVTSISCDTHKYGYSVKGTSTLLFNSAELRAHMYFVSTEWPGGIYASPTVAGSRPGGLVACTWASLLATGQDGYMRRAKAIHKTAMAIKEGIKSGAAGPHVQLIGESFSSVVAFCTPRINVFEVMDQMKNKHGWVLNPLQMPQGVHVCVTYPISGKEDEFLANLQASAAYVHTHKKAEVEGAAAIYGLTSTLPDRVAVGDTVKIYLDCSLEDSKDAAAASGKTKAQ